MVLDKLVDLRTALNNPLTMFIVGGMVSLCCLTIAFIVFPESVGMFTTVLITMAMTPFMVNLIYHETEDTENDIAKGTSFLERHYDIISVYVALFLGMVLSLSIVFILLPGTLVEDVFSDQISEIERIQGSFLSLAMFEIILINNIGVLLISFLFSFLFGSGAIFILAWNASVLSAAIGLVAKSIGGIYGLPSAVLVFFPHGSLEILAYFFGAIGGGLVSVTVTKRKSKYFWTIIRDSLKLLVVGFILLILAAIVESIQL